MTIKLSFILALLTSLWSSQLLAQDTNFSFKLEVEDGGLRMTSDYGTNWNELQTYSILSNTYYVSNYGTFNDTSQQDNSSFFIKINLKKDTMNLEGLSGTEWENFTFDCPDKTCIFYITHKDVKTSSSDKSSISDEKVTERLQELEAQKDQIQKKEKEKLKTAIAQLSEEDLPQQTLDSLKMDLAEKAAKNIENQMAILDNSIEYFERNQEDVSIGEQDSRGNSELNINLGGWKLLSISENNYGNNPALGTKEYFVQPSKRVKITSENKGQVESYPRVADDFLVLGLAFNNAMPDGGSLDDTGIRFAGSRTFEIGYARDFRVFEKSNWLRIKYGVSLQFNGLKPEGNRIFETDGTQTSIEDFDFNLRKNKFRMDNLIFPVHFQIGKSDARLNEKTGKAYFSDHNFKVGIGGFVGLNLLNTQKLKYTNDLGTRTKERQRDDFNTNNLLYGLSTYIGWEEFSIFAQYNINPLFRNSPMDMNNFQIGVRFDIN
jgi:hypothetical protein